MSHGSLRRQLTIPFIHNPCLILSKPLVFPLTMHGRSSSTAFKVLNHVFCFVYFTRHCTATKAKIDTSPSLPSHAHLSFNDLINRPIPIPKTCFPGLYSVGFHQVPISFFFPLPVFSPANKSPYELDTWCHQDTWRHLVGEQGWRLLSGYVELAWRSCRGQPHGLTGASWLCFNVLY